jgi:zeaxanthin glucosyltransferase
MRIGVATVAATGHLNAMTALARRLTSRGHETTFLCRPDGERAARDADLHFEPLCELEFPLGVNDDILRKLSALTGEEALQFTMQALGSASQAVLKSLPGILKRLKFDGVVIDSALFGASAAARLARVPFATVFCTPILDLNGGMPPWHFPWPHEDSDVARYRNLQGVAGFLKLVEPSYRTQLEILKQAGISVNESNNFEWVRSPLVCITQVPAVFDFPGIHLPAHYHRTGPFHDGFGRAEVSFPWQRLTGEPLIYASMGTVQNGLLDVFRMILKATERPGYQVVLSVGPNIAMESFQSGAASTIVVSQAPQLDLLKRASLCVTHAGLNTTLEALAQGVPLVAIPITNDQPGVAARILASGTGLFVPIAQLTPEALSGMVDAVLTNPAYRQRALVLQSAIQSLDGLTMASKLIETAFELAA